MWALCVHISEPEIKNALWYNFFMWILNTLVAIESSYFSVCQHVPVQISNLSASVVALTAFVRHLPHVRPHLYLKTWCVYAREALVTFVCLLTSMCHLVFLQLMYVLVCKSYHIALCAFCKVRWRCIFLWRCIWYNKKKGWKQGHIHGRRGGYSGIFWGKSRI